MLKVGDKAPKISLSGDDGHVHQVTSEGRTVVVYFYPKDDTPGCTVEAKDFSTPEAQARFAAANATVYGISKDTVQSHGKFRDKHGLHVRLLSDPELTVHGAFGAYGEKTMYGRSVMGTIRSTFVLRDGRVAHAYPKVRVPGHVDAVLAAIEAHADGAAVKKATGKPSARAADAPLAEAPASGRSKREGGPTSAKPKAPKAAKAKTK